MKAVRFAPVLVAAFALYSSSVAVAGYNYHNNYHNLAGSWKITVVIPAGSINCPGPDECILHALATATRDGAVVQTAALRDVSVGHGVWKYTGDNHFIINSTYFRFDPSSGAAAGTSATVTEIDLDENGDVANGTFENRLLDFNGAEVGSFSGTTTITRIIP